MYTSDKNLKTSLQRILNGLIITAFCAVFGEIYELFGHGVYSDFMIYAFMIPLLFSVIPATFHLIFGKNEIPDITRHLWNYGVSTLTVGCIFQGLLEIYGTTNRLVFIYPVIGFGFLVAAVTVWIVKRRTGACHF